MRGVTTKHPDYEANIAIWTKIRDTIKGEEAIKEKKTDYLPAFVPADEDRYTGFSFTWRQASSRQRKDADCVHLK